MNVAAFIESVLESAALSWLERLGWSVRNSLDIAHGDLMVSNARTSGERIPMNELKTCFKKVDYDLSGLLHYIDVGDIGLPDIQRPFVWTNAKVRDLFDSMYRGFPVGYLLFWANGAVDGARQIGTEGKQKAPNLLIVDGQQRLTSLYSVLRGKRVLDSDYKSRQIEIAFRPRDGKFEVADAAIRRDPEWVANISDVWISGKSSRRLVNDFIEQHKSKATLSEDEERDDRPQPRPPV